MVTQTLGNFMRVVGFIRFQAEYLSRTGLSCNFIRRAGEVFMRGTVATVGDAIHPVFGNFPEAGMNITDRGFMRLLPGDLLPAFGGAHQQMWHFHYAIVNQDHQRFAHLNRRCRPVALADTDRNGIALIPRLFKAFLLPFTGWHITRALFRKVDAGVMTIAKFPHPLGQAVNTHVIGDLIEEGIRGFFQRFGHVQVAVAPFFPVTIAFFRARQLPPAGVKQAGIAGDHPCAERGYGHVRFNGRGGRINPLGGAVNQRRIRVVQ